MSRVPFLAHQGDVLIMEVPSIPATAAPVPLNGEATLALGETSGHRHAVVGREVTMFRDDGAGGGVYLRLDKPMPIEHLHGDKLTGEHGSWVIPAAVPVIVEIQSQWSDANEPIRVED